MAGLDINMSKELDSVKRLYDNSVSSNEKLHNQHKQISKKMSLVFNQIKVLFSDLSQIEKDLNRQSLMLGNSKNTVESEKIKAKKEILQQVISLCNNCLGNISKN